ncbi:hypothetical protein TNCV_5032551 [Trichonephila clavipes]|nr:hypothetical protein TNCV_5032551 [Trichonephila clavipes]
MRPICVALVTAFEASKMESASHSLKNTAIGSVDCRIPIGSRIGPITKVTDLCPACHEFESSTKEDRPCRGGRWSFNTSRLKLPLIGVVWMLGDVSSSGVVDVT